VDYFLEKWNPEKKKYGFVDFLRDENAVFYYSHDWFWSTNGKALFQHGWRDYTCYYEMEIVEN
jgi:hypothetical protein